MFLFHIVVTNGNAYDAGAHSGLYTLVAELEHILVSCLSQLCCLLYCPHLVYTLVVRPKCCGTTTDFWLWLRNVFSPGTSGTGLEVGLTASHLQSSCFASGPSLVSQQTQGVQQFCGSIKIYFFFATDQDFSI